MPKFPNTLFNSGFHRFIVRNIHQSISKTRVFLVSKLLFKFLFKCSLHSLGIKVGSEYAVTILY